MDLTDIPGDAYDGEEPPPELDALESPDSLLKDGSIRKRLLDAVIGIRTPTKVSTIAERADCDTETARDYLEWFDEMGLVHRHDGRPVRYERNDAYFQWRRIDRIREEYSEQEIIDALGDTLEQIEDYRAQFDATHPDKVSLVNAAQEQDLSTETAWEALSEWETLEQRAALLDEARRNNPVTGSKPGPVDA
jgi:predicted ArsR family transcriptional regulator